MELDACITSFFNVGGRDLEKIVSLFKPETLAKGDFFQKAGRFSDRFSFIQSGLIRVFADAGDKQITQWIATKGYFVVDLYSFVFHSAAKWNMQALTDCALYTITHKDYNNLKQTIPDWLELEKFFITRCFAAMEDRIFTHLSMAANERYELLFQTQPELFNQVPLQYLASMLGMEPETFSRIRKKKNS